MKYDYETVADSGSRYSFKVRDDRANVYVNDKLWGEPQGSRFMTTLIRDILNLNKADNITLSDIENKYNVIFKALELACEQLKVTNIEISNNSDFEF